MRSQGDGSDGWGWTALVGALSGAFYAWTLLPGPHWHDTAEFIASGRWLTVSHAPGHPVHATLTHGIQLLPLGDAGLRANLGSALAVVAALCVFHRLLRRLAPQAHGLALALAALLPMVMPAIWLQAVRAEVYGLQLLLTVVVADLAHRSRGLDARLVPALALAMGLAGANHTLIAVASLPLAALASGRLLKRHLSALPWAALTGLLALSAYLYLPIRATAGGVVGWDQPDTPQAFFDVVSGRAWQRNLTSAGEQLDLTAQVGKLSGWFIEQVGLVGAGVLFLLVAAAVLPVLRGRGDRRALIGGALLVVATLATRGLYDFDPLNPDIGGYFAGAAVALLAVVVVLACATHRHLVWIFGGVLAVAAVGFDPGERMGARSAPRFARAALAEMPPEGVYVTSDYSTWFLTGYLTACEGRRPDVLPVFRGQMYTPWFQARAARVHPERARWLNRLFHPPSDEAPWSPGQVRVEPGVRMADWITRLSPAGLSRSLDGSPAEPQAAFARTGPAPVDLDGRRARGAHHVSHAMVSKARAEAGAPGALDLARWHLDQAEALAPGDPLVARMVEGLDPARPR